MQIEMTITIPEELVEKVRTQVLSDGAQRTPESLEAEVRCRIKRAIRQSLSDEAAKLLRNNLS